MPGPSAWGEGSGLWGTYQTMSLGDAVAWDDAAAAGCAEAADAPPRAIKVAAAKPARMRRAVRRIDVMTDLSGGVSRDATDLACRSGSRNRTAD
jgi:hypothetical protein